MALRHLDISNCACLRDLQLRMLEQPIAELESRRSASKVGTHKSYCQTMCYRCQQILHIAQQI